MNSRLVAANIARPDEIVMLSAHGDTPRQPTGTAPSPRVGAKALLPKIVTCAGVGVGPEVPSTWPVALSAWTDQYGNEFRVTAGSRAPAVSRGPAQLSVVALEPPTICQAATPVAPVQLGVSCVPPSA